MTTFSPVSAFGFIEGVGGPEVVFILLIVMVLFGGKSLPNFARTLGKSVREFKKATGAVEAEIQRAINEEPETPTSYKDQPANPVGGDYRLPAPYSTTSSAALPPSAPGVPDAIPGAPTAQLGSPDLMGDPTVLVAPAPLLSHGEALPTGSEGSETGKNAEASLSSGEGKAV